MVDKIRLVEQNLETAECWLRSLKDKGIAVERAHANLLEALATIEEIKDELD